MVTRYAGAAARLLQPAARPEGARLRELHPAAPDPIEGDVDRPLLGFPPELLAQLQDEVPFDQYLQAKCQVASSCCGKLYEVQTASLQATTVSQVERSDSKVLCSLCHCHPPCGWIRSAAMSFTAAHTLPKMPLLISQQHCLSMRQWSSGDRALCGQHGLPRAAGRNHGNQCWRHNGNAHHRRRLQAPAGAAVSAACVLPSYWRIFLQLSLTMGLQTALAAARFYPALCSACPAPCACTRDGDETGLALALLGMSYMVWRTT